LLSLAANPHAAYVLDEEVQAPCGPVMADGGFEEFSGPMTPG
jgi:hypothetical protein